MRRAFTLAALTLVFPWAQSVADTARPTHTSPSPALRAEMVYHGVTPGVPPAGADADRPWPQDRDDRPIDVLHYALDLSVSDASSALSGTVQITLRPLEAMSAVVLDLLSGELVVAAVLLDGAGAAFTHADDLLTVQLGRTADPAEKLDIEVTYSGAPAGFRLLGYTRSLLGPISGGERPVVLQSVSAPDAARSWWPCHDTPYDAATVTLTLTTPASMRLVSAGMQTQDVLLPGDPPASPADLGHADRDSGVSGVDRGQRLCELV